MSRFLNYVALSAEEKSDLESIMILGSSSLVSCASKFFEKADKASRVEFLDLLFSGEIENMIDNGSLKNNFFTLAELTSIWEIRANEVRMLQGYSKSLVKIYIKYITKFQYLISNNNLNDDLLEITVIDNARLSMYFFESRNVSFHTFMLTFVNNSIMDLLRSFSKKSKLNYINESQIQEDSKTGKAFQIASFAKENPEYTEKDISLLYEAIEQTDLTKIERELIEASLRKSEFDKVSDQAKLIDQVLEDNRNPKNGKKYCKWQGFLLLEKATKKIKEKYEELLTQIS